MRGDLASLLEREWDPGERVLWSGRPDPRRFGKRFIPTLVSVSGIFSFFTAAFLLIMLSEYRDAAADGYTHESMVSFVLGHDALIMVLTLGVCVPLPFLFLFFVRGQAGRTLYALTDRRAIVLRGLRNGGVTERDYDWVELAHLRRVERADGAGDLFFEGARGASSTASTTSTHGFFSIPDVLGIERLVRSMTCGNPVADR